jgi:hypothetical protein
MRGITIVALRSVMVMVVAVDARRVAAVSPW